MIWSRIDFGDHPLYGSIDMAGYEKRFNAVYQNDYFIEFEATTLSALGKNIPIPGGYLRLFPWLLMKFVSQYLKSNDIYVFYIHPFELSRFPVLTSLRIPQF